MRPCTMSRSGTCQTHVLKLALTGEKTIYSDFTRFLLAAGMVCTPIAALAQAVDGPRMVPVTRSLENFRAETAASRILDVPLPGSCA